MLLPSCVLVVDVQNGFISPATAELPAAIRQFLKTTQFQHRIFTRFINPGAGSMFVEVLNWKQMQSGTEIAISPELEDLPTLVVDKHTYSPFLNTELENALREREVRKLLVCGINTDICVLTTAVELADRDFHPVVVKDLCMSTAGTEPHEAALRILPRYIGGKNVVSSNELLSPPPPLLRSGCGDDCVICGFAVRFMILCYDFLCVIDLAFFKIVGCYLVRQPTQKVSFGLVLDR